MACSHTSSCELYVQFAADPSIQLWKAHYCDVEYQRCARYAMALQGKAVPLTLLPNGKQIETAISEADRGLHALFNAIQKNRLPMVKAFMKTKVTGMLVSNSDGVTALMYAAGLGRTEIMQFFLDNGCNPHTRSKKGQTALDIASAAGHKDCARILKEVMVRIPAPQEEAAPTQPAGDLPRSALMGRIMGFLRGHKPEPV